MGRVTIPTFVQRRTRRDTLDSFSDRLSTNISISEIDDKAAPYSPAGSSGSSTFLASPGGAADDKEKQLLAASGLADVPRIEMPVPPQRVHAPEHAREVADVPASVRPLSFVSGHEHSDDMV